jgi:acyl-CoA synthetase (AMP-forming)/AMP-acid ligase II
VKCFNRGTCFKRAQTAFNKKTLMQNNDIHNNTVRTLHDILIHAAQHHPDSGIGYVNTDGTIIFQTYPDLLSKAGRLLQGLSVLGCSAGDKIILAPSNNAETISLLWACFLGRMVPTILQPPVSFSEYNPPLEKMEKVFRKLEGPKVILSGGQALTFNFSVIPRENIFSLDAIPKVTGDPEFLNPDESDLAFIQFSSGSTGDPKGIMLTHKNILTNLNAVNTSFDSNLQDRMVNWMPLYHDMGLVGFHLAPVYGCYNQYHIDTLDFIKRPFIWLDVIDKVRGTITGCPNFGQALLLRYLRRNHGGHWDLSTMKVIANGAEPISANIMTEFMDLLAPHQLKAEAMMPGYGLAESTLAVTFSPLHQMPTVVPFYRKELHHDLKAIPAPARTGSLVQLIPSVGKALYIEYRIVDDNDQVLEDGRVGHIQIKGPSVTAGYYNDPAATLQVHCRDWLRTGDQGFVFEDNLYITGRYKDIIFVHGKNFYANDLEHLAQTIEGVVYGKAIIGGVFDEKMGHDRVLLFLTGSVSQEMINTFIRIRKLFVETLGITIDTLIPVKSNQIPKTSSGKIQRFKLISAYLKGEYDEVIGSTNRLLQGMESL